MEDKTRSVEEKVVVVMTLRKVGPLHAQKGYWKACTWRRLGSLTEGARSKECAAHATRAGTQ